MSLICKTGQSRKQEAFQFLLGFGVKVGSEEQPWRMLQRQREETVQAFHTLPGRLVFGFYLAVHM